MANHTYLTTYSLYGVRRLVILLNDMSSAISGVKHQASKASPCLRGDQNRFNRPYQASIGSLGTTLPSSHQPWVNEGSPRVVRGVPSFIDGVGCLRLLKRRSRQRLIRSGIREPRSLGTRNRDGWHFDIWNKSNRLSRWIDRCERLSSPNLVWVTTELADALFQPRQMVFRRLEALPVASISGGRNTVLVPE